MRRVIIGCFSAVVLFILFVVLFTFVKRPYELVLLDRFGTLKPESQQTRILNNWFFKLPTDTLVRIDQRLHLKTMQLREITTGGQENVSIQPFVVWRIVDPMKFRLKANGSDAMAEDIMEGRVKALVDQEIGSHKLDDFFNTDEGTEKRTRDMEAKIAAEATNGSVDGKIPGLDEIGIEVADMGFSRMAFTPANAPSVYQRMVAELTEKARKYESTGLADAQTILAEGQRQSAETRSNAQREAAGIMGQADRQALEILAGVNQAQSTREFYQFWKSLDYTKAALAKNTVLVLSSDTPILKPLFQMPLPGQFTLPVPSATNPASGVLQVPSPKLSPEPSLMPR
ncbi:MAG TPA: SPFH domain-containing protein [Phycisphaerae bacterium]|jgi:membrane protease subunit HflC